MKYIYDEIDDTLYRVDPETNAVCTISFLGHIDMAGRRAIVEEDPIAEGRLRHLSDFRIWAGRSSAKYTKKFCDICKGPISPLISAEDHILKHHLDKVLDWTAGVVLIIDNGREEEHTQEPQEYLSQREMEIILKEVKTAFQTLIPEDGNGNPAFRCNICGALVSKPAEHLVNAHFDEIFD